MASTASPMVPPERTGQVRIDLMSRLGFGRPGPSRRKAGSPSQAQASESKRSPKHRAEKK